jgi:hypothetical protein
VHDRADGQHGVEMKKQKVKKKIRKFHDRPWINNMLAELDSKGLTQWSRTPESEEILYRHILAAFNDENTHPMEKLMCYASLNKKERLGYM